MKLYKIITKTFSSAESANNWAKEAKFKNYIILIEREGGYLGPNFSVALPFRRR